MLDEADRLLDMGFEITLNSILVRLPRQRRTGLFSATQTKEVQALVRAGLRNPVAVAVSEKKTVDLQSGKEEVRLNVSDIINISIYFTEPCLIIDPFNYFQQMRTPASLSNYYMTCEPDKKFSQLIKFINSNTSEKSGKFMVFFSTCACVEYFGLLITK